MPALTRSRTANAALPRIAAAPALKPHVLVVEADEDLRMALGAFFEVVGYSVEVVGDGPEALRLLTHGLVPDVILLDAEIPLPEGVTLGAVLRDPRWASIAAVALTVDDRGLAMELSDRAAVLEKPVDGEALLTAIRRQIQRRSPRR